MTHYGVLRDYRFPESADDIRGATLYGVDDKKLGKIDDVIFDHTTGNISYIVVDTGGWLTTRKFLVPADRLRESTEHEDDFSVDLIKEQIEKLPPYNEKDLQTNEGWADYEGRYRSQWETGPVMHRAETDRNITPTTSQLLGNPASSPNNSVPLDIEEESLYDEEIDEQDMDAANADTGRVIAAGTDAVVISNSASGIGDRWDTFQARLRERRKEAAIGCKSCGVGPASSRSDSVDTLKKAI